MKKGRYISLAWILVISGLLAVPVYFLFIRSFLFETIKQGRAAFGYSLISRFAPLLVKQPLEAQLQLIGDIGEQLAYRFAFLSLTSGILLLAFFKFSVFSNRFSAYWNREIPVSAFNAWRIIICLALIWFCKDWALHPKALLEMSAYYKPVSFYKVFHLPLPSAVVLTGLIIAFFVSVLLTLLNRLSIVASSIAAFVFILLTGYSFCFEKTDHPFVPFSYAIMLLPFQLYYLRRSIKEGADQAVAWPVQLTKLLIILCYFFAGLEKLIYSRLDFLHPDSFRMLLYFQGLPSGTALAKNDFFVAVLPVFTVIFEMSFILLLWKEKLKWIILPAGLVFHACLQYFFGVGALLAWGITYIFFFDLTPLLIFFKPKTFQPAL